MRRRLRSMHLWLLACCAIAVAAPLPIVAQEGVASFRFTDGSVEVDVATGGADGRIRLSDGAPGRISALDRAGTGDAVFSLSGRTLSLEHRSVAPGDYHVVVPRDTDVSLVVDGVRVASMRAAAGPRQLDWLWRGGAGPRSAGAAAAPRRPTRRSFAVNAYAGPPVADSVDVAFPERVRSIRILVDGAGFAVRGDRSVSFGSHEASRWGVITPRTDGSAITIELPADVERFKLRVAGLVVWELRDGRGRAYCEPVAEIERPDRGMVWVFTPDDGRLSCPIDRGPQPA